MNDVNKNRITARAFWLGLLSSAFFAAMTVYFCNRRGLYVSSSQIPVLPYMLLVVMALLINPVCRRIRRLQPFSAAEILTVFVMGMVSSGISTFGLSSQLIPLAGSLFNGSWNTPQSKWSLNIAPYVKEDFFLSENGFAETAHRYMRKLEQVAQSRKAYEAALVLESADRQKAEAEAEYEASRRASSAPGEFDVRIYRAESALKLARAAQRDASAEWRRYARPPGEKSAQEAIRIYPEKLDRLEGDAARLKAEMDTLQGRAFEKVALFRRGLPPELRAFPGFIPKGDEGIMTYFARARRTVNGQRSAYHLIECRQMWKNRQPGDAAKLLHAAVQPLEPFTNTVPLLARRGQIDRHMLDIRQQLNSITAPAGGEKQAALRERDHRQKTLEHEWQSWRQERDAVIFELKMADRIGQVIASLGSLATAAPALGPDEALRRLDFIHGQYRYFDGTPRRFLLGDIPWRDWARPLMRWGGLIGLTYLLLLTFNVLVFRQWAHHEKLTYPLADLPETLAGAHDTDDGHIPSIFRSGLFWAGASVSGLVLGWNLVALLQVIPGMMPLDLTNSWRPYIEKTLLEGLLPTTRSEIFFTMIGLAFLLPQKVSFSLWFFHVVFLVQLLFMVWTGFGVSEDSFPADWWMGMNFRTAQGGGALLIFAAVVLFKCRHYLLCAVFPWEVKGLDAAEKRELRISSMLFWMAAAGVILMLWKGMGAHPGYASVYLLGILLVTIGLMRSVTEGGLLGFQMWASPFHFLKTCFGLTKSWSAFPWLAPLMIYHAVLFLDVKTFIAPAMSNALKIRSDLRMSRWRFHGLLVTAILAAMAVALLTEILLSYSSGADGMSSWFYGSFPQLSCYNFMSGLMNTPPPAQPQETGWLIFGGMAMAALLFFRRTCFWLPHPIGLIMMVNPLMKSYWFSIFIGWVFKSLVSKYGSRDLYARTRVFFIGLIFGELVLVALGMALSDVFNITSTGSGMMIDLNKSTL